jgi:single-strand DNA-binding protein
MNSVYLLGNLTRAAELKDVGSTQLTNFTLAVRNSFKDDADFINCTAFGKTAEVIAKYTDKGSRILVTGRIQTRSYETNEGAKRSVTEVVVGNVTLLDSKPKTEPEAPQQELDDTEELPF